MNIHASLLPKHRGNAGGIYVSGRGDGQGGRYHQHPRHRRPGPHHPYPRAYDRDHQQAYPHLPLSGAGEKKLRYDFLNFYID